VLREGAQEELRSKRLGFVHLKLLAGNDLEALDDEVDKRISHNVRGVGLALDCRHAQPQEPAELMVRRLMVGRFLVRHLMLRRLGAQLEPFGAISISK
jgi:hypothetical protein